MLLLRSPKTDTFPTNIDICFFDVEYLDCPVKLGEVTIEKCSPADLEYIEKRLNKKIGSSEITVLVSRGNRFYIVSHSVKAVENQLEHMELPFDCISMKI